MISRRLVASRACVAPIPSDARLPDGSYSIYSFQRLVHLMLGYENVMAERSSAALKVLADAHDWFGSV